MKKILPQKPKRKTAHTNQLITAVIDQFISASAKERKSILRFINWTIEGAKDTGLENFYIEIRSRVLEVQA